MKEALYYEEREDKKVKCVLCPRECIIKEGNLGICGVRKNEDGKLYSIVYAKPCSVNVDPIEKKPLFHFLTGSKAYSIGTVGCNLSCEFCQNWKISKASFEKIAFIKLNPEKVVEEAIANNCSTIAYTYTEPTIFYEYMLDIAKLAKKKGLKNVMITNGFINPGPLKELLEYMDAANVDLKSFDDKFYRKYTGAWLEPVLNSLKLMKEKGIWIEITNLIIPGLNDDLELIEKTCKWIKEELGSSVPLHFSRFFPHYKMKDIKETSEEILIKSGEITKKYLNYEYIGNIYLDKWGNTYCSKCSDLLIERKGFNVIHFNNKCKCGKRLEGVW